MKISLILTCAGKGTRAGFGKNKILQPVSGTPCFLSALNTFIASGKIDEYVVTANPDDFDLIRSLCPQFVKIVTGGNTRSESVKNALDAVTGDIVLIHDGARPFVTEKMISDCIDTTLSFGSAIPCLPSINTIVNSEGDNIKEYLGKENICYVQTPQGFISEDIKLAYSLAGNLSENDDGGIYLRYIKNPRIYLGDPKNVKLTFKDDFDKKEVRFGTGFDCHKLIEGRKLVLGGIEIAHEKGLLGHSDADVLTHAVMDAILSGAGLHDIGYYFPDTDQKYKDADSINLLREVLALIGKEGFTVKSISAVIMAEKPKLLKHIPTIKENLADVLGISVGKIGVSATTLEGLGFVGREEGICVHANAVLEK